MAIQPQTQKALSLSLANGKKKKKIVVSYLLDEVTRRRDTM